MEVSGLLDTLTRISPRTVLVNPAAMCRGLGENMSGNVEVYEETPVSQITAGHIECASLSRVLTDEEQDAMGGEPSGKMEYSMVDRGLVVFVRLKFHYGSHNSGPFQQP